MEIDQIKAVDNRHIAFLILSGITLCFASVNLLETGTINQLNGYQFLEEVVRTVPDAFNRYSLFLPVSLIAGTATIWIDRDFPGLSKQKAIVVALVLGISLSWIVLSRVLQFPICGDDSYIDFRYVRNWVDGVGFDYNPGERVIGFTSHIHLLLLYLAKLVFFGISIDVISQMMNVFFEILNVSLLYFFLKDIFKKHSAALAGVFAYAFDPFGIQQTVFGKEAHILECFMILCIWAMHRKRYHAAAWLSSLMPFIRPEAVLWWGITLIWSIKEKKGEAIKIYLAPLALVALIVTAMYLYFGTVVPHGMIAKFKMFYPNLPFLTLSLVLRGIGTSIFIPRYFTAQTDQLPYLTVLFFPSLLCAVVTLLVSFKMFGKSVLRWYIFAVCAFVLVFGIKNEIFFIWYHSWFFLLPVLILAVMMPSLLQIMQDSSKTTTKRVLAGSAFAYLIFVQLIQQIALPVPNLTSFAFRLEPEFHRIAQFGRAYKIIQSYPGYESAAIGTMEVGYLGFLHKGKILDFCGLVSPEVVKIGPPPLSCQDEKAGEILEINPAAVKKFQPDYLITLEAFGRELLKDPYFQKNYREIVWLENNYLKSRGIFVYKLTPGDYKSERSESIN